MSCLCLMPFSSLHVAPDGSIRLCSSNTNILFSAGQVKSLDEAWSHPSYVKIRKAMLEGKRPSACVSACYSQEDVGLVSKRKKFNAAKLPVRERGAISMATDHPPIRYLDIAFSNVCNLKCTMCTSHYSTAWQKPDAEAVSEGMTFRRSVAPYPVLGDEMLEEILALTPQLLAVWVKGGEPLVDEKCLSYLKKLSERSDRNDYLHVFLQTNGTRWNPTVRDAIQGLSPEIGISIDGTESTYEWIRGFPFAKIDANIRAFASEPAVGKVVLQFTLSAYNVFNIEDMIRYFLNLKAYFPKVETLCFGGIVRQEWGNVHAVPLAVRQTVAERLREVTRGIEHHFENLEGLLKVLDAREAREAYFYSTGYQWLQFCERMRGQKLSEIDPRFANIFPEHTPALTAPHTSGCNLE